MKTMHSTDAEFRITKTLVCSILGNILPFQIQFEFNS